MAGELELLQQIAHNTAARESVWIAVISAGAALIGASIGALMSHLGLRSNQKIEGSKLKADLISRERLRWLQDIRQRLTSFYSNLDMQYNLLKRPVTHGTMATYQSELDGYSKTISEQCNLLILMLNPAKPKQRQLREALNDAQAFFLACVSTKTLASATFDDLLYQKIKTCAFDAATTIGIETWAQIKSLE